MTAQWSKAAFCGQNLLKFSLHDVWFVEYFTHHFQSCYFFLQLEFLILNLKYFCTISLNMRMCLIHIPRVPASSTCPAACAILLPSSSAYPPIQTLAAPSWLSLQTNFTQSLLLMTLRQATLSQSSLPWRWR